MKSPTHKEDVELQVLGQMKNMCVSGNMVEKIGR